MRSVVTGAAGFIGSHLAERLLVLGHEVIGIDCFTDYYPSEVKEDNIRDLAGKSRFKLVRENILNADLNSILQGVDFVFHTAAQPGVSASFDNVDVYVKHNIFATLKLLDAAKAARTKKFVLASSSSVYGELSIYPFKEAFPVKPVSPYAMTKLKAEELGLIYFNDDRLPVVILRYFTVYGPKQRPDMAIYRLIKAALTGGTFILYGDGTQERDFTYISDAVSATIRAAQLGKAGEIYNIGSGVTISMNELIRIVEMISGKQIKLDRQAAARGEMNKTLSDISKARAEFGYSPMVSIKEGITKQIEWMKKNT